MNESRLVIVWVRPAGYLTIIALIPRMDNTQVVFVHNHYIEFHIRIT